MVEAGHSLTRGSRLGANDDVIITTVMAAVGGKCDGDDDDDDDRTWDRNQNIYILTSRKSEYICISVLC